MTINTPTDIISIPMSWLCKEASKVVSDALEAGLMILTAKDKVRLLPPLTITYEEIDAGLAILEKVLA